MRPIVLAIAAVLLATPALAGEPASGTAVTPEVRAKAAAQTSRAAVQKQVQSVQVAQNAARVTAPVKLAPHTH
ncbi:MAG: hypothetical protein H6906_10280 [Hyphomicrobiales bacterium]|nr:hypothetical protein [Hyphomicrobiales bacterium]